MKQEPSDELVRLEGHGFLTVVICIIPPQEGNLAIFTKVPPASSIVPFRM
jgi:hypothetical protein